MASDKFTKDFSDFGAYTRPGMIYPNMFDHLPSNKGGDSQPGLQYMTQLALSAYGEYHVIDECVPEIDGTNVTGHIGYVMITGNIVEVDTIYKTTLSDGYYLTIDSDGGYGTTGAKPTGVIVAKNIGGTIYNITRRESNSINYFPTGVVFYGETYHYENIIMNSYDIREASNITGDVITGGTLLISNNITVGGNVDGRNVSTDGSNLDNLYTTIGLSALSAQEVNQLETIGETTTISSTQWGYLGSSNQHVRTTDSPTFGALSVTNNITVGGTVDSVDIAARDHAKSHAITSTLDHTANAWKLLYTNSGGNITEIALSATAGYVLKSAGATSAPYWSNDIDTDTNTHRGIDDIPVDGQTSESITSNWAYDHAAWATARVDQSVKSGANPSFGSPSIGIVNLTNRIDGNNAGSVIINAIGGAGYVALQTEGSTRWMVSNNGEFLPNYGNTYDIGSESAPVKAIEYHNLIDRTCADFSTYTSQALYTSLKMIKGRKDGFLHHSENTKYYFKHIDMASVPDEFAIIAKKDHSVQKMPQLKKGISLNKRRYKEIDVNPKKESIQYKKGEKCGIDFGEMTYALKDLVVKMYEEIQDLKQEIEELKK